MGISWLLLLSAALAGPAKDKEPADQTVDAGSFGVFMNGRRVATEKFSIQQNPAGSVATSEFKTEAALTPPFSLRNCNWRRTAICESTSGKKSAREKRKR